MAVEDAHEDRDALQRPVAEPEFGRRHEEADRRDDAVGRRDHQALAHRRDALGIAEEIDAPDREDAADPAERAPQPVEDEGRNREAGDEDVAFRMDRRESAAACWR